MTVFKYIIAVFVFIFLFIEGLLLYEFSEAFYVKPKAFTSIDAIIVLAGGEGRIQEAIDLYERYKPGHFIISGVGKKFNIKKYRLKTDLSVDKAVVIDKSSQSTVENAIESAKILKSKSPSKILLLTSTYHMHRSLYVFKKIFPPETEFYPYPVETPNFTFNEWYKHPKSMYLILKEFVKYQWYKILL